VTNLRNGRVAQVRVVDRGPARGPRAEGVIIDVSSGVAGALNFVRSGRTRVRVEVLRWGHDQS
jgi:rare lipoprotein A